MKKILGVLAVSILVPASAWAGLLDKAKGAVTCDDDHGVEQAGKDMDDKAYKALIATETAHADIGDANGNADVAKAARANLDKWKDQTKAPSGADRMKAIGTAATDIQKYADEVAAKKLADPGKKSISDARNQLRMAVIYVGWASKIGQPVPGNAQDAITANKACSAKVKGPADAAAGLGQLTTNIKTTYSKVSAAADKTGAPPQSAAEKSQQDAAIGAPAGISG